MPRPLLSAVVAACLIGGVAATAQARPPLREVDKIDNGMMAIAIADDIRKRCDGISARMIHAFSVLNGLQAEARRLGYSRDEVNDYVTSRAEKDRMREKAQRYLASQGVDATKKQEICDFGQAEIARRGPIGQLLR